jgi:uncharacterized glyoxalase superfamily protein PhnB
MALHRVVYLNETGNDWTISRSVLSHRLFTGDGMVIQRLTVLLNVEDVATSIDFYARALGFSLVDSWRYEGRFGWAKLAIGSIELMLNEHGENAPARRKNHQGHRDVVLYFDVDDLDSRWAALEQDGLRPGVIRKEDYGTRQFALVDLDGYEIAVTGN